MMCCSAFCACIIWLSRIFHYNLTEQLLKLSRPILSEKLPSIYVSVLAALRNNDVPSTDYGVEVLFGYSSPESLIVEQIESEGLSPSQYRNFLRSSEENSALFDHSSVVIDKADFSPDRLKAYFTARLITGMESSIENDVSVNFILSTTGMNDDDCWLIDSMLIRPSKLRRRRRR